MLAGLAEACKVLCVNGLSVSLWIRRFLVRSQEGQLPIGNCMRRRHLHVMAAFVFSQANGRDSTFTTDRNPSLFLVAR
jgi:hypothetical protein